MKLRKKFIIGSFALFVALMQIDNSASAACNNADGLVLPVIDDNISDSLTWQVPFNGYGNYYSKYNGYHPGEDWNLVGGDATADLGKPVYAIGDGEVVKVSNLGTLGYNVVVKYTGTFRIPAKSGYYAEQTVNTLYSAYVHITNPIALNSCVQKGKTVIGKIINPGGGPHLHFEVAYRSTAVTNSTDWWPRDNGQGYYTTISNMVADGFKDPRSVISANQSTTAKPVAPTSLSASASGTSITFRWNDVSSNESGFRVYRWNGSTWASLATTSANTTSYTNSGLSSNMTYYYTVCSYNSAGDSCASTYASATTGSSGSVPSSVSVNPSSGSWTSNQNLAVTSAGATTIYYMMVNTYDGSTPSDPSSPSASSNNGSLSGSSATFQLYGSSGNLKKSKLRFVGCNSYGCGSVSGVYSYSIDQRSTVSKPAAPGSQSAAATSSSSITLSWSDLSNNESGFRPYRWNGSSWSSLGNVSANSTSYVNSGLSANTTYYYYICSYNSAGESCPSNYVQATTTSGSSGSSWDGKNPSGTVCEQDATTVAYNSNSYGQVQLRWSNTCKTNWTRVVPNSSSYSTYGKIRRTSDQLSYTTSGTGTRFTAMVYAPTVQACASGSINGYSLSEVCR